VIVGDQHQLPPPGDAASLLDEARQGRTDDDYSSVARVFFPDGPPGKVAKHAEEEEQSVLAGLDEGGATDIIERRDESIARNGQTVAEVTTEEIREKESVAAEREELIEAKREEPIVEQTEEITITKQDEPLVEDKREEAIVEKTEEPQEEKREEVAAEKPVEEAEKREETITEKIEAFIAAKRAELEAAKAAEVVEEKREEPVAEKAILLISDKIEERVTDKKEEAPANEKSEEVIIEKREEERPHKETVLQAIEAKLSDSVESRPAPEPVAVAKNGQEDEEEAAEPRRSFLSRLFGKSSE
jgi:hypothetical protein